MKSFKILLFSALLAIVLCFGSAALAESDGETIYRAMLIGNENYQGTPLEGCLTDVNRMLNTLQAANEAGGRYLSPVTRTNLTVKEMKDLIDEMQTWGIDNDDVTTFYYAGMGQITEDLTASLIGRDGESLKLIDLRAQLDQLAGTKVVVLDTRHMESYVSNSKRTESQQLSAFNRAVTDTFRGGLTERKYQVMSSATMSKTATASGAAMGTPSGPFTFFLVQGCGYDYKEQKAIDLMADSNRNGAVSMAEAKDYVNANINALASSSGVTMANNIQIYPSEGNYPLLSKRATAEILSISLDQPALSIAAGKTAKLSASILPLNALQKSVSWISSDLAIASVDADGDVTGLRPGSAYVTAITPNGLTAECRVLVRDVVFAESAKMSASKLVIASNQQQTLTLMVDPPESNELVTWKSNDTSVATVNQEGMVSPIRNGTAVITATTESGKEATCAVQVVDAGSVVTEIVADAQEVSLFEGEAQLLNYSLKPSKAVDTGVTWTTSDSKIVQVEQNGLIAGISPGEAVVTVTASSGVSDEVKITVKGATIEFNNKQVTLKKGRKLKLEWKLQPSDSTMSIAWDSSDTAVVTVDQAGNLEALENGEAVITATLANGMKATCKAAVATVPVKGIKLNKTKMTLTAGETGSVSARVSPSNASIKTITWTSGDETIALVDEQGNITALSVGKVNIIGRTHNGKGAKCVLTVNPVQVTSITLSTTSETFRLGLDKTFQLSAEIEPASTVGNRALKWKSSDTKVVSVDQEGLLTIKGEGQATVRASSGKVLADCKITVTQNRTYHSKPTYGKEREVYPSLRQVTYAEGQLLIQMFFANRTKSTVTIPPQGKLKLTLAGGEVYELNDTPNVNSVKLGSGDYEYISYRFSLESNPYLRDLDLRDATVELIPTETSTPASSTAPVNVIDPIDSLTTTGESSATN